MSQFLGFQIVCLDGGGGRDGLSGWVDYRSLSSQSGRGNGGSSDKTSLWVPSGVHWWWLWLWQSVQVSLQACRWCSQIGASWVGSNQMFRFNLTPSGGVFRCCSGGLNWAIPQTLAMWAVLEGWVKARWEGLHSGPPEVREGISHDGRGQSESQAPSWVLK